MKKLIMTLIMLVLLVGCGSNSTSPSDPTAPFSLKQVGALMKPTSEIKVLPSMSEQVYDFDLGTIATTTSFYFIPNNSSTSNITGMKFSFDNPKFVVSPDTLTNLSSPDKNTGVTPLIKVTVVHGKEALGIGYDDMMSADQYGTLTITGENADGEFSVSYTMHVYAKRMVITLKRDMFVLHNYKKWIESMGGVTTLDSLLSDLKYVEFDGESSGCYIEFSNIVLTPDTRMVRVSDFPEYLDATEYYNTYEKKIIGSLSAYNQTMAIASLDNRSNIMGLNPITNCPTYVKVYDGKSYVIPY